MAGLPYPVRLAGYGIRAPKTPVPGREVAGRVEAAGQAVTTLHVGDKVFGIADGSFAKYASARPGQLAPRPANLTSDQAAAVPASGLTALQAIRDHGHVQAGQKVRCWSSAPQAADRRTVTLRDGHGGLLAGGVFVAASGQIQAIALLWMSQPMNATTITRPRA